MSLPVPAPATMSTVGPVLVVGTGLLGTSLALALTASGVEVHLADTSPTSLALARDMGAGSLRVDVEARAADLGTAPPEPTLVVVATPPDVAGSVVIEQLAAHPAAVVTDVASVKARVAAEVVASAGSAASRYVGSHPMAGRERSGAAAADADLFMGRPWVVVAARDTDGTVLTEATAELAVRNLAADVGAHPVRMAAVEHDAAVAAISHVPQLVSSLMAARLESLDGNALSLAGQGLRDVTRIAASDPRLWAAIVVGNAGPVTRILKEIAVDLDTLVTGVESAALDPGDPALAAPGRAAQIAPGAVGAVTDVMGRGNAGQARIPGKHGGAPRRYAQVQVLIPDAPGSLGRLFTDVGDAGVNIEDLILEHSAGQRVGLALLSVAPAAAAGLEESLTRLGWRVVGS